MDLFTELNSVAECLDKESIPYALVGGLAFSVWVQARSTEDIDLLVLPSDWERIRDLLAPLGYQELSGPLDFKQVRIRRLTKLEGVEALALDFVLADGDLPEGLKRSTRLEQDGHSYPVAPPDVLISLKEKRMSPQDESDIRELRKLRKGGKP
jgi:hypothetical protein